MVNADKMKCEAFVEKLYSQALLGLTHATIQESFNDPFTAQPELMIRYNALRCQAVSITVIRIIFDVYVYRMYFQCVSLVLHLHQPVCECGSCADIA